MILRSFSSNAPCTPRSNFKQLSSKSQRKSPVAKRGEQVVAVIRFLCTDRRLSAALCAFSELRRRLSDHPFFCPHLDHPVSSVLAAAAAVRSLSCGSGLHALSISLGLLPSNHYTVSRVAAFYAACDLLDHARSAVEESAPRFAFPWNILISAFLRRKCWQGAVLTYGTMLKRGIDPDNFTNSSALKACGELRELELGKEVHRRIESSDSACDLCLCNALLAMYAKCGAADHARKVFDEMRQRDIVSWNSMILGYSLVGRWEETSELLMRMQRKGLELNSVTSNTVICGLVYSGNPAEALALMSNAKRRKSTVSALDHVSLVLGLKACSGLGCLKQGKEIHGFAIRSGCDELEIVRNALITLYSKCRNVTCARALFERSSARSAVTWNAMISAFAGINSFLEAASLFRQMIGSKTRPSQTTILTMLALCANNADLRHGEQLHSYAVRHGFERYLPVGNCIMDVYCKSGRASLAHRVFSLMAACDRISYTTLTAGYASQREGAVVRKLIDEMIGRGMEPDRIMIEAVRSAWSRRRVHHHG